MERRDPCHPNLGLLREEGAQFWVVSGRGRLCQGKGEHPYHSGGVRGFPLPLTLLIRRRPGTLLV